MPDTPDAVSCLSPESAGSAELGASNPYLELSYHFGMLLGVEDFETEQSYHRGKMRLHNAWLHRAGVVWGFDVRLDLAHGELRVLPGLAQDGAGHELHLERDACLNLGARLPSLAKEAGLDLGPTSGDVRLAAHVVARFKACLTRQVPAMAEPCERAAGGTAYSRVYETVELLLRPGRAPVEPLPYHRLRLLLGLEAPLLVEGEIAAADQAVLDERTRLSSLSPSERPAALRSTLQRLAALETIEMAPALSPEQERSLFPAEENAAVVLAEITELHFERQGDAWVVKDGKVDTSVRPVHVATATLQDLLAGELLPGSAAAPGPGPRVDPLSVQFAAKTVSFRVDSELAAKSVAPQAFEVSFFDEAGGWQSVVVDDASFDGATSTVSVEMHTLPAGSLTRLIVRGTGPTPLLGKNLVPLAGSLTSPAGSAHDGHDYVHVERS